MSKPIKIQRDNASRRNPSRHSTPEKAYFGADFIPFEAEAREGEDIPRKRKRDDIESNELEQRLPKLARYEDGSFTTPWMKNMSSKLPRDAAELYEIVIYFLYLYHQLIYSQLQ